MTSSSPRDTQGQASVVSLEKGQRSVTTTVVGVIGELFLTLAVVCALYILWQLWWTGVVSEQTQAKQSSGVSWTDPSKSADGYKIAKAQKGTPPVEATPGNGDVVGQIYIPRFGAQWKRLIVQGITADQLARHGMGHYPMTQLPGELGNFAVAGHRSGYGEPLGNVPDFVKGDAIVIRTDQYWYVYHYTSHEIVLPTQTDVIAPVPHHLGETPTQRLITLTTCEPRYTAATHRWITYGTFDYWAKVSDGIPKELATTGANGAVEFTQNDNQTWTSKIPPLTTILLWLVIAYAIIYIAAAVAWKYPATRAAARKALASVRGAAEGAGTGVGTGTIGVDAKSAETIRKYSKYEMRSVSMYGWIYRHHPGIAPVRWILMIILALIATVLLFAWGFPWMAANIPFLQVASNFVAVG
ncbi:MAG: class E sortase [Bifidobacteriaceae bacterium]|nr:class E sortase [Bifidobacteriaceae bacterium]